MRKKVFTMFLVGVMVLSLTACGGKETEETNSTPSQPTVEQRVEENVTSKSLSETVAEKEVAESTVQEGSLEDTAIGNREILDLSDTIMINLGEGRDFTLEVPVYALSNMYDIDNGVGYLSNVEGSGMFSECYNISLNEEYKCSDVDEGYKYIVDFYNEAQNAVSKEKYDSAYMLGDVNSKYIIAYYVDNVNPNGKWVNITEEYRIFDCASKTMCRIKLFVEKDATLYGDDILEKSTASYREQLRTAIENLANN